MSIIKKYRNIIYRIGAAFVLLGALFKILHMPVGNYLLFLGMVTCLLLFLFEAFNRSVED